MSSVTTEFSESILKTVPKFLRTLPRWLNWVAIPDPEKPEKKPRKVPVYVSGERRSGDLGSAADLAQLVTLDIAVESARKNNRGIGFAFVDEDGLVGIDLDNCIDTETGEFSVMAQKICTAASSYTEMSPSWTGCHIITKGSMTSCKSSKIEAYTKGRFFCFTGFRIDEYGHDVRDPGDAFFATLSKTIDKIKSMDMAAKTTSNAEVHRVRNTCIQPDDERDFSLVQDAIAVISSDSYDDWVTIGMALRSRFGEAGYDIWYNWSRSSSKFQPSEMPRKWISFRKSDGGVGLGTIFMRAEACGFKIPRKQAHTKQRSVKQPTGINDCQVSNPDESSEADGHKNGGCDDNNHDEPPVQALSETKNGMSREKQEKIAPPTEWPDPIDFLGEVKPPRPPLEILPEVLGNYIFDQSDMIGSDPGIMVSACLVACAGAISDEIRISPKRHNAGWTERPCLWGAFVAGPSEKKSPAMSAAFGPIKKIEASLAESRRRENEEYQAALEEYRNSQRSKKTSGTVAKPEAPDRTQYLVGATTIEAMQQITADNPRGVLAIYDELAAWFGSMDAYSKSGTSKDRPNWLELYNGGSKSFNTVSRGEIWVKNWSASIFGNIQPEPIRKIARAIPDDGLLQRFFVICSTSASWIGSDRKPTPGVKKAYYELVEWLLSLRQEREDQYIELDNDAMKVKEELYDWARKITSSELVRGGLASHVGKYEGLYARLLVVWHCVTMFSAGRWSWVVTKQVAEECAKFVREFLFPHAVYFYQGILGGTEGDMAVKSVARAILVIDDSEITNRTLSRKCREWARMNENQKAEVMQMLDSYGWVSPTMIVAGRKLPKSWMVNPKLRIAFKELSDFEKERIEKMKSMFPNLFSKKQHES